MGKAGKAKASTSQPQEARKPAEDDDDAILSAASRMVQARDREQDLASTTTRGLYTL